MKHMKRWRSKPFRVNTDAAKARRPAGAAGRWRRRAWRWRSRHSILLMTACHALALRMHAYTQDPVAKAGCPLRGSRWRRRARRSQKQTRHSSHDSLSRAGSPHACLYTGPVAEAGFPRRGRRWRRRTWLWRSRDSIPFITACDALALHMHACTQGPVAEAGCLREL